MFGPASLEDKHLLWEREEPSSTPAEEKSFVGLVHEFLNNAHYMLHYLDQLKSTGKKKTAPSTKENMTIPLTEKVCESAA